MCSNHSFIEYLLSVIIMISCSIAGDGISVCMYVGISIVCM